MANVAEIQVERAGDTHPESETPARASRARRLGGSLLLSLGAAAVATASVAIAQRRGRALRAVGQVMGEAAGELGRGVLAGMFGTLAITFASTVDQLVTEIAHARKEKREPDLNVAKAIVSPWSFSADVVSKVVGITATDAEHARRLSIMAHWGYGSAWGLSLAAMRALGMPRVAAMGTLLAGQLGAEMIVMPAFDLFSPPTKWGRRAIVSSIYQHAIYATAAVTAFEWVRPSWRR